MAKIYKNNEEGKKEFIEEVINTIVENEGHFVCAEYKVTSSGEYIVLHRYNMKDTPLYIDITADSIEAVIRDFMKKFTTLVNSEIERN